MTKKGEFQPDSVGPRIAAWLRRAYPGPGKAKRIACDFAAGERTAKAWLGGDRPRGRAFDLMAERWGPAFLAHVYEGCDWSLSLAHSVELSAIKSRIKEMEKLHAAAADDRARDDEAVSLAGSGVVAAA